MGALGSLLESVSDPRDEAVAKKAKGAYGTGALGSMLGEVEASAAMAQRAGQRAYAEKPQSALAQITVDPAREMVANLGDRAKVLATLRSLSPEQRQEALKLTPGIAQQLGDNRGGAVGRTLGAVSRGISNVSQPAMELAGAVTGTDWGGTPEEIAFIRQLEAAASQEFNPALPSDPWYERGPLQAVEMAPWMATVVGGAGVWRAAATGVAGRVAGRAAAGGKVAGVVQKAGQAVGNAPRAVGLPALTAGKAGELAGITAAAFPGQYAQEVDSLKELGMVDDSRLRLLAGGTAAIAGLVEGVVPNPFAGKVALTEGALKAARQYLWEAAKKAPGEMSEEYLQGVTSGLGEYVAQYVGSKTEFDFGDGQIVKFNPAERKSIADALQKGWEQAKEAALPMAFLLGVPDVGGAGLSAARAQRLTRLQEILAKGPVSRKDGKELGIEGNQDERTAIAAAEKSQLEQEAASGGTSPPADQTGTQPPVPVGPPLQPQEPVKAGKPMAVRNKEGASVYGSLVNETDDTVVLELDNGEQQWFPKSEWKPHLIGRTEWETKDASQVPTNEGSPNAQGNAREGSQVPVGSQVRQPGQEQGGAQPSSQEPPAPEVQVAPQSAISFLKEKFPDDPRVDDAMLKYGAENVARNYGWKPQEVTPEERLRAAIGLMLFEARKENEGFAIPPMTLEDVEGEVELLEEKLKRGKKLSKDDIRTLRQRGGIANEVNQAIENDPTAFIGELRKQLDAIKAAGLENPPVPPAQQQAEVAATELRQAGYERAMDIESRFGLSAADGHFFDVAIDAVSANPAKWTTLAEGIQKEALKASAAAKGSFEKVGDLKLAKAIAGHYLSGLQSEPTKPSTAGTSEGVSTKSTIGSPTVSPDAPATETSMGEAAGENRPSEARAEEQPRRGEVGGKLAAGEVVTTSSGRQTTPFPKIVMGSDRKAGNTLQRVDKWLYDNAVEEARSRGDDFNLRQFEAEDPAKMPPASKDAMEEYLFGEQPPVLKPFTKPVVTPPAAPAEQPTAHTAPQPESKWQSETRSKLESVPALKGAKVEADEKTGTAKVTRPDGLEFVFHLNHDEELAQAARSKGKDPKSIHGWYVRKPGEKVGRIYIRSDADHTNVASHELFHGLEDWGVVTKEEVDSLGGREAAAEKYGKWASVKLRKKDSVFQKIHDFLEPLFSSQRRFFEDVSKRKAEKKQEPASSTIVDDKAEQAEDDFTAAVNAAFDERFGGGKKKDKKEKPQPSWSEQSQKNFIKQKRALTKAQGTKDPRKVLEAAEQGLASFEEFGMPDDWARWERAKDDASFAIRRIESGLEAPGWEMPAEPEQAAQPKRGTLAEKAKARKERTSAAKAEKLAKFKDLLKQKKITSGFDPELATAAVELTAAAIDDGVSTFAEYVAWIADNIGESATRTIAPYLEAGWNRLGTYDRFRGKIDKAGKVADILTEVSDETSTDYGTLEAPNRVALGKHFQRQLESGKDYKSIVEARKEAAVLIAGDGASIEPGTPAAKSVDEAVEQGVVRAARSIAESSSDPLEVYDSLLDLYERQPRLNVRTGTSMRQQAYSTPAPAAWIANILSDTSRDSIAYDSSAGNGMLLLGVEPKNAIANELNPERAQALRELGYQVHEGDATEYTPDQKPERIIINPPFGELEGKTWSVGGITTDKIDHAISLKTLESLPEDGKAVLIIGSKGFEQRQPKDELRRGEAYKNDKNFYNALYDGYNVTDHFTLHGDMYSKQGAAFPIDVIVIDGRGKSELPKPYQIDRQNAIPRVINNWQELRDVGERYVDTGTGRPSSLSTEQVDDDMGGLSSLLEGQGKGDVKKGGRPSEDAGVGGSISPRGVSQPQESGGDSGQSDVPGAPNKQGSGKSKRLSSDDKSGASTGPNQRDDAGGLDRVADVDDQETGFQTAYKQRSGSRNVGTLVPTTHVRAVQDALDKAEDRYGNLDEFVAGELGYSIPELEKYFSAEQVDALALTIARHKEGKAFVLGDQTGVGKGRVAAATMVYAKRQGLVPVFVTQSSDLYSDMYRDLQDIGQHSEDEPFYALATNTLMGKDKLELPDGTTMQQSSDFSRNTFNDVAASVVRGDGPVAMIVIEKTTDAEGRPLGKTPKGKQRVRKVKEQREYDAVFTAYSQMQTVAGETKDRHAAMSLIAPNAFFVLDESHNAGGVNEGGAHGDEGPVGRAARLRSLVSDAQGVLFLSATYAKNPGVMDLYAKTGMGDAIQGSDEALIETIIKGGLPLQQVLSEMLVESGTYMRREKSFKGIGFSAKVEQTGEAEADEVAGIFNAINELDGIKNEIIKSKAFKRWLTAQGLGIGKDSATGKRGMDSSTFSSIVHNLVDQMLLSIKADAVADEAIATLKRGESPIIGLSNTAGAALENYLENFPAEVGEDIEFGFNSTTSRYLERSREIMLTDVDATGKKTSRRVRLPDEVLGEDGVAAYNAAKALIEGFAADIPASPIDHIRNRIEEAGYKVAEITGRSMMVDYSEGKMRLARRPSEEQGKAGKLASVRKYNSGEIDALILNQSGSTGLSAHASDKFVNQKRRHMIIAQADRNIDTFMQMLGRINRTGQVEQHKGKEKGSNLPHYTLLMTNVPAEIRPSSVLMKKLASLNANVTADSKGSVSFDAPDILNRVGDRVVAEYIADNPALNHALGDIVEVNHEGSPRVVPDIARKVSGRMAMRPIPEQQAFWDSVTETYAEEIEQLNKLGKNPLAATKMDLGARTLERVEIFSGDTTADSPFLQPAYADRVRVKKQGEPMTPEEIKSAIKSFYGIRTKRKRGPDPFGDMESELHRETITGEDVEQNVTEWTDDLGEAARKWAATQIEIATEAIEAKAAQQVARLVNDEAIARVRSRADRIESAIRRRLNSVAPGMAVEVSEVQEEGRYSDAIDGIVIDVRVKKGKEHLPSGWVATIALSSPDRVLRVPFSRIETAGNSQPGDVYVAPSFSVADDQLYSGWEETGDVYEERIIGTGNVLAAFDRLVSPESRGNIIFFTNEEGVSQRGVLMPRSFNLDRWAADRPVTFTTPQQVLDFISIDPGHQVNDPNFAIQFTLDGATMNVRSPRSRQRSGRYTTNQELIAASGTDFVSVGQILQMKVRGKKQQLAVIEAAQKLGPLIAANYKEDARAIVGVPGTVRDTGNQAEADFGKDVGKGLGITASVPLAGPHRGMGLSVRHFFQRFFTSQGELPSDVYDAKVRKEGRVAKEMNRLRNRATDLRRGIKKALNGKQLTQADIERMNAVLRGEKPLSTVPVAVRAPLKAMRDHIDSLSSHLILEGVAQGDLVGLITENMGVYATRSYRVFDNPKWRDQVPDVVRNRAVAAIRALNPDKSDAEVVGILESLLFRGAADSPVALLKGSKLGSKDLSTFIARKDIPEWLRELWGEYKDAGVNYARSVFKMAHLLANQQFLNEVRDAGLGKWLRTDEEGPIINEYGEVITPIAAASSSVMEPLNGLLTTPEIKKAFERFDAPGAMPEWLRVMMTVNYAVKYGKTVGSVMTHVRNTVSNVGFAVANGHWRLDKAGKAVWGTATGTFQLSDAKFREYYSHLAELGIVGEDVRAGELKDALRDASEADIDEFLYNREARHAKKAVAAGRAGVRFINSLYQAEDGVWKIYAWENEKARYAKAHPEWSQQQVEEYAAKIVRNTYPTYSKIPEAIKTLRRFPLVGTFVSFPSEVVRTTFHTAALGIEEMQSKETRSIGAQRLAGTVVSIGMLSVLSRSMMAMFGIGDDDDEDLRWFVPPWQENSRFVYLNKPQDATFHFVDLGYSDPHAYLTDSVVAFMRGDDWKESLGKATAEFMRPFASEEILAKALMDLRSNEGDKIYNPKDGIGEQAKDIVSHLWTNALEPGTLSSGRRIITAIGGADPSKSVRDEVLAVTTGQRIQQVDVEHSLGFRVRDFGKALTQIQGIARKTVTSRGTASGVMVAADLARMEKLRLAAFSEMQQIAGAARRLGVSEESIRTMLIAELPDDVAEQLMTGDYSAYEMTPQTVRQMMSAKPDEFMQRFSAWHGQRTPEAIRSYVGQRLANSEPDEIKSELDMLGVTLDEAKLSLREYWQKRGWPIRDKGALVDALRSRFRKLDALYAQ